MSKKDYLLVKHSIEALYISGYRGAVFVPVDDNMDDMDDGFVSATMSWSKEKIRTSKQNRAIWKYCRLISQSMIDGGIDLKRLLSAKKVDLPVTTDLVMEVIWRPLMQAMFNKKSTTKLTTKEVSKVYRVVDRHMNENFEITHPFPQKNKEE